MHNTVLYQGLADAVLALHVAIVAFVIAGLILTIAGNLLAWRWVNALWFRLAHLGAIVIVVAESWFGVVCPLTSRNVAARQGSRINLHRQLRRALVAAHFVLRCATVGLYTRLLDLCHSRRGDLGALSTETQASCS